MSEHEQAEQERIESALAAALANICKNPLLFVSEMDVHVLVLKKLMELSSMKPEDLFKTQCTIGLRKGKPSRTTYKTMRIHKEYGVHGMPKSRLDVVILDKESINRIDDPLNLKAKRKWIEPQYAFEFGTEKAAASAKGLAKHVGSDLRKLAKAKKGYLVHIHRNLCQSIGGRRADNKQKCKELETEIAAALDKAKDEDITRNITAVFLLVDIGNRGREIRNKVRLFRIKRFRPIPQDMLEEAIKNAIKAKPTS